MTVRALCAKTGKWFYKSFIKPSSNCHTRLLSLDCNLFLITFEVRIMDKIYEIGLFVGMPSILMASAAFAGIAANTSYSQNAR